MTRPARVIACAVMAGCAAGWAADVRAAEDPPPQESPAPADRVARFDRFPEPGSGVDVAGELVEINHSDRRGGLRLDGDFDVNRYEQSPTFHFALLPYCEVYFHGAPASLADIPLGTHLHGRFLLPPEGEPPLATFEAAEAKVAEKYLPRQTHAYVLEDDFSFRARRGLAWKVDTIDLEKGKLGLVAVRVKVPAAEAAAPDVPAAEAPAAEEPAAERPAAQTVPASPPAFEPIAPEERLTLDIDAATRIWKGNGGGALADLAAGQIVQANLGWTPDWGNRGFHAADLWLDEESRAAASERQRRVQVRHMRHFFVPAFIDHVEHLEGGRGIITVTLFGGMDQSLYDDICKKTQLVYLAAAQRTLRLWRMEHHHQYGNVIEIEQAADPPPGSSGYRLRIKMSPQLLEAYRPGRIVRIRQARWPNPSHPKEMRAIGMDP